jgi:hypothetical protein
MKKRDGFVANSSSSSFVVAFPKGFSATPMAVQDYLFGSRATIRYFDQISDITPAAASLEIYEAMRGQRPNKMREIAALIARSGAHSGPDYEEFVTADQNQAPELFVAQEKAYRKIAYDIDAQWRKVQTSRLDPEKYDLYLFEFFDDNHLGAVLEQGDVFAATPFIRISNH